MSRPTRVYPKSLSKYNLLHTRKSKMYSGVELTVLHLIKETSCFFISIISWCFCCSTFKIQKFGFKLEYNIPILKDKKSIEFLELNSWKDYIEKENNKKDSDIIETIQLLDRLFPNKKKVYFYELDSLIGAYCNGLFISYDDNGNIVKEDEHDIERRKYYNYKYQGSLSNVDIEYSDEINKLYSSYSNYSGEDKNERSRLYSVYRDAAADFLFKNHDLTPTFIEICKNSIVCPYIFSDCTVKGSEYENAGDIFMVVTDDTVYFEIERHY